MINLKRLRTLRKEMGLTQRDIAEILGTTAQYYQSYESGKRPLTVQRLEILADFYGTSTDYLLDRTENKSQPAV